MKTRFFCLGLSVSVFLFALAGRAWGDDLNKILANPKLTFTLFAEVKQVYIEFEKPASRFQHEQKEFARLVAKAQDAQDEAYKLYATTYVYGSTQREVGALAKRIRSLSLVFNANLDDMVAHPFGRESDASLVNIKRFKESTKVLAQAWKEVKGLKLTAERDATRKIDLAVKRCRDSNEAVVKFWNNRFYDVALAHHLRKHIREAVVRADKFGRPDSVKHEQDDLIQEREDLAGEITKLVQLRDQALSEVIKSPKDETKARELVARIEKLNEKNEEFERIEEEIENETKLTPKGAGEDKRAYTELKLIERLERPLTRREENGDETLR